MNKVQVLIAKLKALIHRDEAILAQDLQNLERQLPTGTQEFEEFVARVVSITGQFADYMSMKFALASILIHADAKHGSLPDKYFADRLVKSAANQVASQVFQDIKNQQQQDAAQLKAEQEANFTYFKSNLPELISQYKGKFLVLEDSSVKAFFDTFSAALEWAVKNCKSDSYIIQQATDEAEHKAKALEQQTQQAAVTAPGATPTNERQQT